MSELSIQKSKEILNEILLERRLQQIKWGEQNHPSLDPMLTERDKQRMYEEYEIPSELRAKQMCQRAERNGQLTWTHIAVEELCEAVGANTEKERREELIQLAAVIVAWIERIDRY